MTTDNRTSVQIVADALRSMPEAERDDDRDPAVVVAEYAVAALEAAARAAQGAAPVLPSSTVDEDARSLSAWPTVDEVRERFEKPADRIAFGRLIAEVERAAAEKALTDAASEVEDLIDGYESTADEMRGRGEWADSNRYSNYSAGLNMAVTKLRARAEAEWLKEQCR